MTNFALTPDEAPSANLAIDRMHALNREAYNPVSYGPFGALQCYQPTASAGPFHPPAPILISRNEGPRWLLHLDSCVSRDQVT